jgi:small GTP-binding protein
MEKNCAPLPSDIIPQNTKTPMKGSDMNINMNNNEEEKSEGDDSGYFTPFDPNKPPKPKKKEEKIEIIREKLPKYDLMYKIIVLGNIAVGKSCLALRATEGIFKENMRSTVPLSTYNFYVKINNTSINLQIWDTCGMEKYRALIKGYYVNTSLAIIVYSVTDKNSFEDVNVWYKLLKENISDCKIFLIANKVDSPERVITTEEGNKCREDFNFDLYMETSAKSGFNANELFINAANILYKENEKLNKLRKGSNTSEKKMMNNIKLRKKKSGENNDEEEGEYDEGCCA